MTAAIIPDARTNTAGISSWPKENEFWVNGSGHVERRTHLRAYRSSVAGVGGGAAKTVSQS
jgi:hypothetical protein